MEFLGEMNIYREGELSGDFEGEIREMRNQQEKNQAGFGGSETNLPLQATLPTRPEQVLHSLKCQKFPAIFLRKTQYFYRFFGKFPDISYQSRLCTNTIF